MSVTIRPYRNGGWEIDIRVVTPDGTRHLRERKRSPISSRSAALRWAEGRERALFQRLMDPAPHTHRERRSRHDGRSRHASWTATHGPTGRSRAGSRPRR
jgi:hypothetical protein